MCNVSQLSAGLKHSQDNPRKPYLESMGGLYPCQVIENETFQYMDDQLYFLVVQVYH